MRKWMFVALSMMSFSVEGLVACSSDSPSAPPPATAERTLVHVSAAQGGTVADKSSKAVLTIPAGALAADVDITLDVLPASNGSAGEVYDFGPDGLQFLVPANLSVRADGVPPGKSLSIARLDGASFSPTAGSTFANGTVSAPIPHFSKYSTVLIDGAASVADASAEASVGDSPVSSMTVQFDGKSFSFSTKGSGGSGGVKWQGPSMDAISYPENTWPKENPRFTLNVLLTGFLASTGFTPGTYDLADPNLKNLVVTLNTASQAEVPVGQTVPYAVYSSSSTVDGAGSSQDSVPKAGASGTVTVVHYKYQTDPYGSSYPIYDLSLSNVVLPIAYVGGTAPSFPTTVTVTSARLVRAPER